MHVLNAQTHQPFNEWLVLAGMNPDNLLIDEIRIGRSTPLKRIEFKARGKTGMIRKPFSYMAVYVREVQPTDTFLNNTHLRRRRPRWKCGR